MSDNQKENTSIQKLEKFKITVDFLKFEATTLWQIFSAFFVAHALILNCISTLFTKQGETITEYVFIFTLGIVGFFLSLLWFGSFRVNSKWYYYRMKEQAKVSEKDYLESIGDEKWFLLNKDAEKQAQRNSMFINKNAGYYMIAIFIIIYVLIIGWSLCQICCNCK